MMLDSFYNSNPNLRLKILRDLITKFRGYIAGAEIDNDIGIFGGSGITQSIDNLTSLSGFSGFLDKLKGENNITDQEKMIIEKFTSGTYGSYTVHDLLTNPSIFSDVTLNLLTEDNPDIKETGGLIDSLAVVFGPCESGETFPDINLRDPNSDPQNLEYLTMQSSCTKYEYPNLNGQLLTKAIFDSLKQEVKQSIVDDFNISEFPDAYVKRSVLKKPIDELPDIDLFMQAGYVDYEYKRENQKWYTRKTGSSNKWLDVNSSSANILDNEYLSQLATSQETPTGNSAANTEQYTIETFSSFLTVNPQKMPHYALTPADIHPPNINITPGDPDAILPNMASFIIRKPLFGKGSRNDNYLSIFFGAVSQLELSRCTPYLSLTFFTKQPKGEKINKLSSIGYMRFEDGKSGIFSKLDNVGGMTADSLNRFVKNSQVDSELSSINYMDMFTSPQTMVNANMNSSDGKNPFGINNLNNDSVIQGLEDALDPFAPMLTLKNFNATVSGGGDFMITNRRAKVSMVLHDRSRLNQIAPFVSLSQLASTIVKVEYGWSHPDGDLVRSTNEIGKFLNSLRETHIYSLNTSDFSFSGNDVSINMVLEFWGGSDFKNTHVATGNKVPTNKLKSKLIDVINHMERNKVINSKREKSSIEIIGSVSKDSKDSASDGEHIEAANRKVIKTIEVIRNSVKSSMILLPSIDVSNLEAKIDNLNKEIADGKKVENHYHSEILLEYFQILNRNSLISLDEDINELIVQDDPSAFLDLFLGDNNSFITALRSLEKSAKKTLAQELVEKLNSVTGTVVKKVEGGESNSLITPDPFMTRLACVFSEQNKEAPLLWPTGHISLGKLISNFIALPLNSNHNYDEVQILFYPVNNYAAGARKYTTASLPVNIQVFKAEIYKMIKSESDLTIRGMFDMLSNYFQNNNLDIYELKKSSFEPVTKEKEEKIRGEPNFKNNAYKYVEETFNYIPADAKERKIAEDDYVKSRLENSKKLESSLSNDLKRIYSEDGLGLGSLSSFKKPVLHLELETMPKITPKPVSSINAGDVLGSLGAAISNTFDPDSSDITQETGVDNDFKILKIHVYDENATSRPAETLFMDGLVEPESFLPVAGQLNKYLADSDTSVSNDLINAIKEFSLDSNRYIANMSTREIKHYVSRAFPTIRYGSQQSVVKSLNVSSNTSDDIVNARMHEAIHRSETRSDSNVDKGKKETLRKEPLEEFIIPTSIDMAIYGCPFITMGLNIFVDMQTGTDIDNVYMVGDVSHTISAGEYSTNVSLFLPQIGTSRDMRARLESALGTIDPEDIKSNHVNDLLTDY